jgi:hypothetical protein
MFEVLMELAERNPSFRWYYQFCDFGLKMKIIRIDDKNRITSRMIDTPIDPTIDILIELIEEEFEL